MKEHSKLGFIKSLFSASQPAPPRAKLPLHIPVVPRADKQAVAVEPLIEALLRHDYAPVSLFKETTRLLEKINPLPLPADQRMRHTHMLLNQVNDAFGNMFPRFVDQGSGVPETREQREGISHGVRVVELLAISYKLVFQQDYADLSDDLSKSERLTMAALRVLELIRLEQLLRAFRYQQLPRHSWRDCNQLFFTVRTFADVRAAHPMKLRIFNSVIAPPRGMFPELGTIEQIYLSIQITGLLDVISWPTHLMYVVDSYLGQLDPTLLTQRDSEEDLLPGQVVIYRNQGVPPRFARSQDELGDALRVDLHPLLENVVADRQALDQGQAVRLSEPIRQLGERERVPVLDLLLHKLGPQYRREPRRAVFEVRTVRVYGGFEGIYRFLRTRAGNQDQLPFKMSFWDSLAAQPQMVTAAGSTEPRWIVANESEGGVQLRIQETQFAMPLHIGRLVAYTLSAGDEPKIGYVTRLQRMGDGEVEVAIARLRETATTVVVEELDATDQHVVPALLIHDADGRLQLLCDYKHGVMTGDRLAVLADGHTYTGAVGEICLSKPEFVVFRLHTAD